MKYMLSGLIVLVGMAQIQPLWAQRDLPVPIPIELSSQQPQQVLTGTLTGYEIKDYTILLDKDDWLTLNLKTPNLAAYFNVMAPGENQVAFFIGSTQGTQFSQKIEQAGNYTIRLYMMRSAARRNEVAPYELFIDKANTRPTTDYADGLMGGPDSWQIQNATVPVTLYQGPSRHSPIVDDATLTNGYSLQNKGCLMHLGEKWCHVESAKRPGLIGWVEGQYLKE